MSGTFACMTDRHDWALDDLPTCARELYAWLLRQTPAGKPVEIHLEDFRIHKKGRCRGRGYTLAWIKQCLNLLVEIDLVEVAFKYSGKIFKLVTWHPDRQDAADLKKTLQDAKETRKSFNKNREKQPSNADSLAPLYREIRETTDNPTRHPVSTNEQEGAIDTPTTPKSPEPEIEPQVIQQIEAAGFKLNSTLTTIVRTTTAQIVLDAIEATQQYQRHLQQQKKPLKREPEALLVAAIQKQWRPTALNVAEDALPDGFVAWFELARSVGLVCLSSAQASLTGHPSEVLCVQTVSGEWETFDQMRRLHSVVELQEMVERQRSAMEFTPSPRLVALQMAGG